MLVARYDHVSTWGLLHIAKIQVSLKPQNRTCPKGSQPEYWSLWSLECLDAIIKLKIIQDLCLMVHGCC